MFVYDKKLQYPVKISNPNPRLAAIIISQYGGPDGELGASLRYLSQRYSMPFDEPIDTSYRLAKSKVPIIAGYGVETGRWRIMHQRPAVYLIFLIPLSIQKSK